MTTVRHRELDKELELEASFTSLGTARIFLQLRPWGEETLVVCDEHPCVAWADPYTFLSLKRPCSYGTGACWPRLARVEEQQPGEVLRA
ncbi:hypothetical protein [Streptomyces sp. R44]|uniref:Uncharacterized protein n=1 Tax=Streptomyces sp. R44 TaxID=3238633 RepID=A0AB39T9S5_9ACTN